MGKILEWILNILIYSYSAIKRKGTANTWINLVDILQNIIS